MSFLEMNRIIKLRAEYIKDYYPEEQTHLITLGIQFYVSGRICYYRGLIHLFLVVPMLFRYAIEYLKGYLSYDESMGKIKKYGHNLKKLWKRFKQIEADQTLDRYDGFIDQFNKLEKIRYPKGEELLKLEEKDAFEIDLAFTFDKANYYSGSEEIQWDISTIDELIYEICKRMRNAVPIVEWIEFKYQNFREVFEGNKYFKKGR